MIFEMVRYIDQNTFMSGINFYSNNKFVCSIDLFELYYIKKNDDIGYVLERFVVGSNEKNNITKKPYAFIPELLKESNLESLLKNLMMLP